MSIQLPLPLNWPDYANFDNFYVGDNFQAIHYLKELSQEKKGGCVYLYGAPGVGLTHLLHACCQAVNERGSVAGYLSLTRKNLVPAALECPESFSLFCVDNLDAVAGNSVWEEALFYTYNRTRHSGTTLIMAAHSSPALLSCVLPDLKSRLLANLMFQIKPLSDEEKIKALQARAQKRGLDLPDEVGRYLLMYFPRDMKTLFSVLEKLDYASLAEQRKITVPFVKKFITL